MDERDATANPLLEDPGPPLEASEATPDEDREPTSVKRE
jgi:hypothetical protein